MNLALALLLAASVPFTFIDHRMFVQAYVDGSGPWSMIVDTGTPDLVITPQVARRLQLRTSGRQSVTGAGSGTATSASTIVRRLRLGTVAMPPVGQAEVIDLSPIAKAIGFSRLDGIVGYAQLRHFRVLADADHRTITFSRSPLKTPKNAVSQPFTLAPGGLIRTPAAVDGMHGTFIVDTGDRSALTLFRRFAAANGVYARAPLHNVVTGYGIGGPIYSDLLRTNFSVFGVSLSGVTTRVSRDRGGAFATASEAGSIGNGLLERFNVVYDYPDRRLIAWPARVAAPSTSLLHLPEIPGAPRSAPRSSPAPRTNAPTAIAPRRQSHALA